MKTRFKISSKNRPFNTSPILYRFCATRTLKLVDSRLILKNYQCFEVFQIYQYSLHELTRQFFLAPHFIVPSVRPISISKSGIVKNGGKLNHAVGAAMLSSECRYLNGQPLISIPMVNLVKM